MTDEQIAKGLTKAQRAAVMDDERSPWEACQLNALELVHIEVTKDHSGAMLDMASTLTPLGLAVRAILEKKDD